MKTKYLLQAFVVLAILFSALGMGQQAHAQSGVQIVMRSLTFWDSIYNGYVDTMRYEKWPLTLDGTTEFTVTATRSSGDLSPLVILQNASSNEITRAVGTLTTEQAAGNYFILIQPETSAGGTYSLTIREVEVQIPTDAGVTVTLDPPTIEVGGTTTATVSLVNVPEGGYTSAEFTCTYDPAMIEVSNILADTDLFGADPAVAMNGPANGTFIVAIAGSNGNKAVEDGAAFTFTARGLAIGQAVIECRARVSTGNGTLTEIAFAPITLNITDIVVNGTLTGTVLASKLATVSLYNGETLVATVLADENGAFSVSAPAGAYTAIASAEGFLNAEGTAHLMLGATTEAQPVTLPAGDIDGNGIIDQFDAMTIGMNYNLPTPAAADLNNDANINVLDLELLAANYRLLGPIEWIIPAG
jgi:hypothetical protein